MNVPPKAAPRVVANPLALAVLAFLTMEPMHPYELGRRLRETGKDRNIKFNRGSLYMVVEQLRKAGFIVEQETVRDSQRPERTVYALAVEGRRELYSWMGELIASPQAEYPQFGVALSLLAVLSPAKPSDLLEQRLRALSSQLDECRATVQHANDNKIPWIFLVEEEYRSTMLEAEHRFVVRLVASLKRPDYIRAWQDMHERSKGRP